MTTGVGALTIDFTVSSEGVMPLVWTGTGFAKTFPTDRILDKVGDFAVYINDVGTEFLVKGEFIREYNVDEIGGQIDSDQLVFECLKSDVPGISNACFIKDEDGITNRVTEIRDDGTGWLVLMLAIDTQGMNILTADDGRILTDDNENILFQ